MDFAGEESVLASGAEVSSGAIASSNMSSALSDISGRISDTGRVPEVF
jgi:hypothetical protein